MPTHGPQVQAVQAGADVQVGAPVSSDGSVARSVQPYVLVNLDQDLMRHVANHSDPRFAGMFSGRGGPSGLRIGAGDVLAISVFEAGPGGLFTPAVTAGARPGNFVELPAQTVGRDGNINVPYAGSIPVANRSPSTVERMIEQRLKNRAIEPQVVVTLREQRSSQVSVLGEVNAPAKFTLNPQGERILDAVARAGGPRYPVYETVVALQRNGKKAQASMASLINSPKSNIFVQPGDLVYVTREQKHFVALGASGQNGLFFFDSERVSLSYAMGKAGGLLDERAEPSGVFVYRMEPRHQVARYGVDVTPYGSTIPVVYSINLRDPSGLFLAQNFQMQNKDVIFVGNA
ncbi:MAG: polysaccharide biosynthesis/export family protein, partial [Beijerinckiaceae bacterium]